MPVRKAVHAPSRHRTGYGSPARPETLFCGAGATKVLLDAMIEVARESMTMICVTHEKGFAQAGDRQFRAKVQKIRNSIGGSLTLAALTTNGGFLGCAAA